jgi:hypothetical protein
MNDDWILSAADVADALHCTIDDVRGFIESGDLAAPSRNPVRVRHVDLRVFVRTRQRDALTLGVTPDVNPDVLASRPAHSGDDEFNL